jgi:hypothetical protein
MNKGTPRVKKTPLKEPVDYVNPNIGTIGHLLTATSPLVQVPHGMVRLAPLPHAAPWIDFWLKKSTVFPAAP